MSDTSSLETPASPPATTLWQRLRFRWRVEQEVHELTRDREREERGVAQAAVHLQPGPWTIALLARRSPGRRR